MNCVPQKFLHLQVRIFIRIRHFFKVLYCDHDRNVGSFGQAVITCSRLHALILWCGFARLLTSNIIIFPASNSPCPVKYFITSFACIQPIMPASAGITPPSAQLGICAAFTPGKISLKLGERVPSSFNELKTDTWPSY